MIPFAFNSAAMRRVENPGRSITNVCPEGSVGMKTAHANQPTDPNAATRTSHTILRTMELV
jgi:hypothetical protein